MDESPGFRFFDLPREVRDSVYDFLTSDRPLTRNIWIINLPHVEAHIADSPRVPLLLASRQFGMEYMDQVFSKVRLKIIGPTIAGGIAALLTRVVDPYACFVERCRIFLPASCGRISPVGAGSGMAESDGDGDGEDEDPFDCYMLTRFYIDLLAAKFYASFERLSSIDIRIGLIVEPTHLQDRRSARLSGHAEKMFDELDKLIKLPPVERVEVVLCADMEDYQRYCDGEQEAAGLPRMFDWTRDQGIGPKGETLEAPDSAVALI